MDILRSIIPYLIPILLLEMALAIAALLDLRRRERVLGEKWVWVLVILLVQIIGPILYFTIGRKDE